MRFYSLDVAPHAVYFGLSRSVALVLNGNVIVCHVVTLGGVVFRQGCIFVFKGPQIPNFLLRQF